MSTRGDFMVTIGLTLDAFLFIYRKQERKRVRFGSDQRDSEEVLQGWRKQSHSAQNSKPFE